MRWELEDDDAGRAFCCQLWLWPPNLVLLPIPGYSGIRLWLPSGYGIRLTSYGYPAENHPTNRWISASDLETYFLFLQFVCVRVRLLLALALANCSWSLYALPMLHFGVVAVAPPPAPILALASDVVFSAMLWSDLLTVSAVWWLLGSLRNQKRVDTKRSRYKKQNTWLHCHLYKIWIKT